MTMSTRLGTSGSATGAPCSVPLITSCSIAPMRGDFEVDLLDPEHRGLITINWLFNWAFSFFKKNLFFIDFGY